MRTSPPDERLARARLLRLAAAHIGLFLGVVVLSYVHPPWHQRPYMEARDRVVEFLGGWGVVPPVGLAVLGIPLLVALMVVTQRRALAEVGEGTLPGARALVVITTSILAAASVFVFPFLSHDIELYHAHAQMVRSGASPYLYPPASALPGKITPDVPWVDQVTPYGPVQLGLQALLAGRVSTPWTAALLLKALNVLPILLFPLCLAGRAGAPAGGWTGAMILVGWQPLLLLELGGMAHADGWSASLAAASLVTLSRGRPLVAGLLLSLACATRIEVLLLLPLALAYLLRRGPHLEPPIGRRWLAILPCLVAVIVVLAYRPLGGISLAMEGLRVEGAKMFRSVPWAIAWLTGSAAAARALQLVVLVTALYFAMAARWNGALFRSAFAAFAAYLLLGKGFLQPWHFCILFFLAAGARLAHERLALGERFLEVATVSLLVGAYSFMQQPWYQTNAWQPISTALAVGPLVAFLGIEMVRRGRRGRSDVASAA